MNRGVQLLLRQVPNRGDRKRAAQVLEVTAGHLSRVLSGEKPAGLPFRQSALKAYGIPLDAWDEPALRSDRGNVLPDERAQSLPEPGGRTVDTSESQLDPEGAA